MNNRDVVKELAAAYKEKGKAAGWLENLEKLRSEKTVTESNYLLLKAKYEDMVNKQSSTVKTIKAKISKQLDSWKQSLKLAQNERDLLKARLDVGELPQAEYQKKIRPIESNIATYKGKIEKLRKLLTATSSNDIESISFPIKDIKNKPENVKTIKPEEKQKTENKIIFPIVIIFILLLAAIIWGFVSLISWGITTISCEPPHLKVGDVHPDFTMRGIDANTYNLSQFLGKKVLLLYEARDCPGSDIEISSVEAAYKNIKQNLNVAIIFGKENIITITDYVNKKKWGLQPILIDEGDRVYKQYGLPEVRPVSVLLDSNGVIQKIKVGPLGSIGEVEAFVGFPRTNYVPQQNQIDRAPTVITDVALSIAGENVLQIKWRTDKLSTSWATIRGQDNVYYRSNEDKNLVTEHSVRVTTNTKIRQGEQYYVLVYSTSASNVTANSDGYFKAGSALPLDTTPPVISNVSVVETNDHGIEVTWQTDEPATSWLSISSKIVSTYPQPDPKLTLSHKVIENSVQFNDIVLVYIRTVDASGNMGEYMKNFTPSATPSVSIGTDIGNKSPNFLLQTLDGKSFDLNNLTGKIVMLNFWMKSCGVCIKEIPYIQTIHDKNLGNKFILLTVTSTQDLPDLQRFIQNMAITFPVSVDAKGSITQDYKIMSYPSTFFIDGQGIIQYIKQGEFRDAAEIESIVLPLINK